MQLDYFTPIRAKLIPSRFWLIITIIGVCGFAALCAIDFASVRFAAPGYLDRALLGFPLAALIASARAFKRLPRRDRIIWSLLGMIGTIIITFGLIFILGGAFHLMIGGQI